MCVLLIGWKLQEWPPLVVAANRDEARRRPSLPPQHHHCGARRVLMPVDQVAGGTWLGVNDAGVLVALTNRADRAFDASRTSRGMLARDALSLDSEAAIRRQLERHVAENDYNGFNMFCADRSHAWVASWNGSLDVVDLQPGAFVLTNAHDLDELPVPEFAQLPWGRATWPELRRWLHALLGDHTTRNGDETALCKHGDTYGTVSAALVHPQPDGGWQMDFAAGNPCTTPFLEYHLKGDATGSGAPPPGRA
jgi:uncharacterized protein with NRDE domain